MFYPPLSFCLRSPSNLWSCFGTRSCASFKFVWYLVSLTHFAASLFPDHKSRWRIRINGWKWIKLNGSSRRWHARKIKRSSMVRLSKAESDCWRKCMAVWWWIRMTSSWRWDNHVKVWTNEYISTLRTFRKWPSSRTIAWLRHSNLHI
jgi:hypothetical protein